MALKDHEQSDLDDPYSVPTGDSIPDVHQVPGILFHPSREPIRTIADLKAAISKPPLKQKLDGLLEANKSVAVKRHATGIAIYVAENRNAIIAGGAILAASLGIIEIRRKRKK